MPAKRLEACAPAIYHLYLDETKSSSIAAVGGLLIPFDLGEPGVASGDGREPDELAWTVNRPWAMEALAQPHANELREAHEGATGPYAAFANADEKHAHVARILSSAAEDTLRDARAVVAITPLREGEEEEAYEAADVGLLALLSSLPDLSKTRFVVVHAEHRGSLDTTKAMHRYFDAVLETMRRAIPSAEQQPEIVIGRDALRRAGGVRKDRRKSNSTADQLGAVLADYVMFFTRAALASPSEPSEGDVKAHLATLGFAPSPFVIRQPVENAHGLAAYLRLLRQDLENVPWLTVVRRLDSRAFGLAAQGGSTLPEQGRRTLLRDIHHELRPFVHWPERARAENLSMRAVVDFLEQTSALIPPGDADTLTCEGAQHKMLLASARTLVGRTTEARADLDGLLRAPLETCEGLDPETMSDLIEAIVSAAVAAADERDFRAATKLIQQAHEIDNTYFGQFKKSCQRAAIRGTQARIAILTGAPREALAHLDAQEEASPSEANMGEVAAWRLVALARGTWEPRVPAHQIESYLDAAAALARGGFSQPLLLWGVSEIMVRHPRLRHAMTSVTLEAANKAVLGVVMVPRTDMLLCRNLGTILWRDGDTTGARDAFLASLSIAPLSSGDGLESALQCAHLRTIAQWLQRDPDEESEHYRAATYAVDTVLRHRTLPAEALAFAQAWRDASRSRDWAPFLQLGGY